MRKKMLSGMIAACLLGMTVRQLIDLAAFLHAQYTVAPTMLYP